MKFIKLYDELYKIYTTYRHTSSYFLFHESSTRGVASRTGRGGGPKVANVSDGDPTVHHISMLSCYRQGRGGGSGQPPLNTPLIHAIG